MQASVVILLGIVVAGGVLIFLIAALPLPDVMERWSSPIATFIQTAGPIEAALLLALTLSMRLVFRWWRSRTAKTEWQTQSNFSSKWGHSLQANSNRFSFMDAESESPVRNLISVPRVFVLSILSFGLYLFWWFYISWKQYRDHSGENAHPIWHALTLLVPIYSVFRIHAHMRTYKELMTERQVTSSIRPGLGAAVAFLIVSHVLGIIGILGIFSGEISKTLVIWLLLESIIVTAITTWLLTSVQVNVNRYWTAVLPRASSCRAGIAEVAITLVGVLFWVDTIATAFSDSWRML